jgi:hypothetical protein
VTTSSRKIWFVYKPLNFHIEMIDRTFDISWLPQPTRMKLNCEVEKADRQ